MIEKLKENVKNILKDNFKGYTLIVLIFVFGAILAKIINPFENDNMEMSIYFDDFVSNVKNYGMDSFETFKNSIRGYSKFVIITFLMSMCIWGYVGILTLVFIKGFSYGIVFSTLFELSQMKGIAFFVCAVLPHTLIVFPCCVAYLLFCIKNSAKISKGTKDVKITLIQPLVFGLVSLFVLSGGALIQAYVEPFLIRVINF